MCTNRLVDGYCRRTVLVVLISGALIASLLGMLPAFDALKLQVPVGDVLQAPEYITLDRASAMQRENDTVSPHPLNATDSIMGSALNDSSTIIDSSDMHDSKATNATQAQVHFLKLGQLDLKDFFSATWIQPVSTFLALDTNTIENVEMGCFSVFRPNKSRLRMTLDWMDFSVEHMSKWWKVLDIFKKNNPVPFNTTVSSFQRYVKNIRVDDNDDTMHQTIAVIAFQQYRTSPEQEKGRMVTITALAATVASLLQAGFGRIVVVGYRDDDAAVVQETFRFIQSGGELDTINATSPTDTPPVTMIGRTEVGYTLATDEEVKSFHVKINIVKAALSGLQSALKGDLEHKRTGEFLGSTRDPSFWRYVYLTEPDTVLQTRPWALPQLKAALDKGLILAPHRLQPVPHESDVRGMKNRNKFLAATGNFSTVMELDPLNGGVCCDELAGRYKPGKDDIETCGTFWWTCGFNPRRNHSRLEPYQLMRLQPGTGIVTLAGTAHGRRCIPSKNSVCRPLDK